MIYSVLLLFSFSLFLFFPAFSFTTVIFELIECKKKKQNLVLLHFFSLTAESSLGSFSKTGFWILALWLRLKDNRTVIQINLHFFCFIPWSLQSELTALIFFMWKNIPEQTEETLPSLSSSFRRPTFIGRVRSSLCVIFWKTKKLSLIFLFLLLLIHQ